MQTRTLLVFVQRGTPLSRRDSLMAAHEQTRDVPYRPDDMFALVAGVDRYPEFLPWCNGARIRRRDKQGENEVLVADLIVSYKVFREQFTSRVTLNPAERRIDVAYVQARSNICTITGTSRRCRAAARASTSSLISSFAAPRSKR